MNTRYIDLGIGYFFLIVGVIGCFAYLGILLGFEISKGQLYLFVPLPERAAPTTPVFLALIAAVGTYLVKK